VSALVANEMAFSFLHSVSLFFFRPSRYREHSDMDYDMLADEFIESTTLVTLKAKHTKRQILKQLFNFNGYVRSNGLSSYVASFQTTGFSE